MNGAADNGESQAPRPVVEPSVVQDLLSQTDGSALARERLAAEIRTLHLETPVDASSSQPGPLGVVSYGVATAPSMPPAPWRPSSGYSEVPKFSGYDDRQTPDKFPQRLEEFCDISGVRDEQRLR
ncbi:hypothetical protein MTO96_019746 [Rhipicephalus appendiculatus]